MNITYRTDFGIKPREWFEIPKFGSAACIAARAEPPYIREQALGCIGSDT